MGMGARMPSLLDVCAECLNICAAGAAGLHRVCAEWAGGLAHRGGHRQPRVPAHRGRTHGMACSAVCEQLLCHSVRGSLVGNCLGSLCGSLASNCPGRVCAAVLAECALLFGRVCAALLAECAWWRSLTTCACCLRPLLCSALVSVCLHVRAHLYMCLCMCLHVDAHLYMCLCVCLRLRACLYMFLCVCLYVSESAGTA